VRSEALSETFTSACHSGLFAALESAKIQVRTAGLGSCIGSLEYALVIGHTALDGFPELSSTAAAPNTHLPWVERRQRPERRRTTWRSFFQGGLTPRRRAGRRTGEHHLPIDWHEPYLLFLSVTVLLLSVVDAFLTLVLLMDGATEVNPVMAFVLSHHPQLFATLKMGFTGVGVLVLVAVARARLFRVMKVGMVLQGVFVAYVVLIGYEWWLVRSIL
jgi:Domain of unknown function (DUF5658)